MVFAKRLLSLVAVTAIAGCSGGGGGAPSGGVQHQPSASAKAKLTIVIPGRKSLKSVRKRRPLYVSPASESIFAQSFPHGNPTSNGQTIEDISAGSGNCTTNPDGSRTCTVYVPAPPGNDDFSLTDYDQAPVKGAIPTQARVLAVASLIGVTIVANTSNPLTIYLRGRPNSFAFTPAVQSLAAGIASQSAPLTLSVLDADGNVITAGANDPYESAVVLTLAEPSGDTGHTLLLKNGGGASTTQTTQSSSDTFSISYDGGGSGGSGLPDTPGYVPPYFATISANVSGGGPVPTPTPVVVAGVAYFSPLYLGNPPGSASLGGGNPATLAFSGSGQSAGVLIQQQYQPLGGGGYGASLGTCGSALTIAQSGPESKLFTVTSAASSGSCQISFNDGVTSYPVNVTF